MGTTHTFYNRTLSQKKKNQYNIYIYIVILLNVCVVYTWWRLDDDGGHVKPDPTKRFPCSNRAPPHTINNNNYARAIAAVVVRGVSVFCTHILNIL